MKILIDDTRLSRELGSLVKRYLVLKETNENDRESNIEIENLLVEMGSLYMSSCKYEQSVLYIITEGRIGNYLPGSTLMRFKKEAGCLL